MGRAYNVIDADGHILEPLDLWDKYIDPKFRDRAPKVVKAENGRERLVIEEHAVGDGRINIGRIGAVGARQGIVEADTMAYKDGKPGGFDPHKRIPDMDDDGIDAVFLYPSLGLFSGAIHDPELAAAVCRAYNRWLADYCKPYPDRLFGSRCCRCSRSTWRSPRCGSPARNWASAAAFCGRRRITALLH